jgi:hypothetical protein
VTSAGAASNIHWQWTSNGYLAVMIGVGLAYVLTLLLTDPAWNPLVPPTRLDESTALPESANGILRSVSRLLFSY